MLRTFMRVLIGSLVLATPIVLRDTSAEERPWVAIEVEGEERGAFLPALRPYTERGSSVRVFVGDARTPVAKDGQIVSGFEFIGWVEGAGTRVQVFGLVPKEGETNTDLTDSNKLTRRDFATYHLAPEQAQPVAEMEPLGLTPMVLRAVRRDEQQR